MATPETPSLKNSATAGHVALLGDSILDNGVYTGGGPDVITQLRSLLPLGWEASLLAVDGSMIADLDRQLARLPSNITHFVISVGGNDVLANLDVMAARVKTSTDAFIKLGQRVVRFEREYRGAIRRAVSLGPKTIICTIYNGNLEGADQEVAALLPDPDAARVALMAFNDAILRVAIGYGLTAIDLRLVCNEPADYANPIEPSSRGGEKIARAIVRALGLTEAVHSAVFTDR